jgi:hypothetical protein
MSRIDELDIVIRHKGSKLVAGIPQLMMYATADDIYAAVTALEKKRAALLADLAEAGVPDVIGMRSYVTEQLQPRPSELGQFTLKALIVLVLIGAIGVVSASVLGSRVEALSTKTDELAARIDARARAFVEETQARIQQYTKVGGHEFWAKLEDQLERAASPDRDLPAEQKQKLLSEIRVVVERWRPFMSEVAPLFADFRGPPACPQGGG